MLSADELQRKWEQRALLFPFEPAMTFTEAGLVLGAGTVLAACGTDRRSRAAFPIDGGEERILALLAIAHGRAVAPETIGHIRRACAHHADGETCLALIQLAYAGLPPFRDPARAAYRLFLADALIADGVTPHNLLKAFAVDPSFLDRTGKRFNVYEPRVLAGNGRDSGEWTHEYGSNVIPAAARQSPDEYRTGNPDEFFDTVYSQFHALARRLDIDETWLLGLAALESGYLDGHDRARNDPFGITHGGGSNVHYASITDAVAYWERRFGPVVRGATSARGFVQRLYDAKYNTARRNWRGSVLDTIKSIPRHLSAWKAKREI